MAAAEVTILLNERQIYDLEWLEHCYKKVRFPNPKCEEFLVEINNTLSHKIRGELDNKYKQQALFSLLGEDYVRIHFPHHKYDVKLLEQTKPDVKKAYIEEMKQLVQEQLAVTLKECGYPDDVSDYQGDNQLGDFLNEVRKVFKEEMEVQMEQETNADRIRDIEADALSAVNDDEQEESNDLIDFKPSQIPGEGFVAAAKHNEQVTKTALKAFKEKMLMFPMPMRQYLWEDYIYSSKGQKKPKGTMKLRKEFKEAVQKKIPPGKMNRAVQSKDARIIYSVIIDSYQTTKVMKPYSDDEHMLNSAHVINVINVLDKYYSNAQIFWLIPFQLVYPMESEERQEDYIIRLSNHLQLFSRFCALPWKDVFAVSTDILDKVKNSDPDYYNHLKNALSEKITPVDVYDFSYEILHKDTKKSAKLWQELYKKKKKDWKDRDLAQFGDPTLYIRKWLSECFTGILGGKTLLFIWDICFMHNWSKKIFYKLGLTILMMIKPWALEADNHRKLSRVLFDEPSNLYMKDIQKAILNFKDYEEDVSQFVACNTNVEYVVIEAEEAPVIVDETPEENNGDIPDEADNNNAEEEKKGEDDEQPEQDAVGESQEIENANNEEQQNDNPDADTDNVPKDDVPEEPTDENQAAGEEGTE